jgi:hypothetical protein
LQADLVAILVSISGKERFRSVMAMVKEISRARWKVEAVDAYPYISPVLTPGGGLQQDLAKRLIQLFEGVTALAEKHRSRLRTPEGGTFS